MIVREIMSTQVRTATPSTTVDEARLAMHRGRFRRLPVVEAGELVGIVVESDLEAAAGSTPLRTVMRGPVITAEPGDPIEQAGRLMLEHKLSVLPVLEDGKVVGILTESDLFEALCTITGVMEPSTRVELVVADRPGAIAHIMNVLESNNVRVVSIVSAPPAEANTRRLVVRLAAIHPESALAELRASGATVISPLPLKEPEL